MLCDLLPQSYSEHLSLPLLGSVLNELIDDGASRRDIDSILDSATSFAAPRLKRTFTAASNIVLRR